MRYRTYDFGGIIVKPSQGNYLCVELDKGRLIPCCLRWFSARPSQGNYLCMELDKGRLISCCLRWFSARCLLWKLLQMESRWLWGSFLRDQRGRWQLINVTRAYEVVCAVCWIFRVEVFAEDEEAGFQ
ncbi:hypothetical protein L798_07572 [Zootermopsis nevadensis]|uniref:Uncharacterized protein n=1 Tax=Zootermopsis nevadensis TaxID=136037 RepID=A0A067QEZ8_ZOONE|nr:hypothetical protein L798_07572 [Zootermopsis nevadensis]